MIRPLVVALAALALSARLLFADPALRVTWLDGVVRIELEGSFPQSSYTVWRSLSPDLGYVPITDRDVLCLGTCFATDPGAVAGQTYFYRFDLVHQDGRFASFGPYPVIVGPEPRGAVAARVVPNPGRGPARIELSVPGRGAPVEVQARLVDIQGRVLRTLHRGPLARGLQRLDWDGRGADCRALEAGLYFLRLDTPEGSSTARVLRLR